MMKKALSILLALLLVFGTTAFALTANAEGEPTIVDQGYCGSYNNPNDVVWVLTDDGTLTVSGTGPMKDYSRNQVPWRSKRAQIQSIVIEDGVTTVGGFTFEQIPNLTSVSLPDSLEKIRQYAFARCTNLKSVEIPNGVTIIENDSFSVCGLTSVAIPDSVVTIEWYAFSDCRNMKTLTLGSGLKKIDYTAFVNCEALEQVILPDSLTYLGEGAFDNCESLTSFTIPAGVTYIQRNPVSGCRNLTEIKVAPENTVYHATGNCLIETETKTLISGCQASTIPRDGSVTSIKASAFYGTRGLKRIGIPISVTSIGEGAFGSCDQLRDVYYGGSEEQWNQIEIVNGNGANNSLVNANIYYNVADWGYCGGEGDGTNLIWVLDNEGTLTISGSGYARNGAFQGRTDVKNVVFLDGTDYIGGNMFAGCSNLESITIQHSSMEEIEVTAFADCDSLSVIYYDGTPAQWDLMTIYYHAENLGGSYTEYAQTMRAYLKSLVQFADTDWGYCGGEGDGTNLMWELSTDYTLTISGTGEMANYTLYDHRTSAPWGPYYIRLKTVVLQPGVTSIGDAAFNGCIALENVTIPAGVLSIGDSAFRGCFALTSITIPDGVTSIPHAAFATCLALTSVMIPDSVTSIDTDAFSYCTALQDVYYGGSEAQWGEIQIDESGEYGNESLLNATIHYHYPGDHTPGENVIENNVPATCTEAGGYDEVVYCAQCPAEISRNHIDVPAPGHSWGEWEVIRPATVDEEGLMRRTCQHNAEHVEEQAIPKLEPDDPSFFDELISFAKGIIDWFLRLFKWLG